MLQEQQILWPVSSVSGMQSPKLSNDWVQSHALTAGWQAVQNFETPRHVGAETAHTL